MGCRCMGFDRFGPLAINRIKGTIWNYMEPSCIYHLMEREAKVPPAICVLLGSLGLLVFILLPFLALPCPFVPFPSHTFVNYLFDPGDWLYTLEADWIDKDIDRSSSAPSKTYFVFPFPFPSLPFPFKVHHARHLNPLFPHLHLPPISHLPSPISAYHFFSPISKSINCVSQTRPIHKFCRFEERRLELTSCTSIPVGTCGFPIDRVIR